MVHTRWSDGVLTNQDGERLCLHFFVEIVLNFENINTIIGAFTKIKGFINLKKLKENFVLTKK